MEGKPLYRTLAVLGFSASAVSALFHASISTQEDRGFFIVVTAVAVLAAVLTAKWSKGARWVSLVAAVLILMGTWWLIFVILEGFALSWLDFTPAIIGFLGSWTALVASILGVIPSRRERQFGEGTQKKLVATGGLVVVLIAASVVISITGKDTLTPAEEAGTTLISMKSNKFDPVKVTVPAGTTTKLLLRNDDAFAHNFFIDDPNVEANLGPGEEKIVNFTPKGAGTVEFTCEFHSGMEGELVVS